MGQREERGRERWVCMPHGFCGVESGTCGERLRVRKTECGNKEGSRVGSSRKGANIWNGQFGKQRAVTQQQEDCTPAFLCHCTQHRHKHKVHFSVYIVHGRRKCRKEKPHRKSLRASSELGKNEHKWRGACTCENICNEPRLGDVPAVTAGGDLSTTSASFLDCVQEM